MRELHHDYEQLPILGHIIWYGLAGVRVDRTTLLRLLTRHGFQGYAPSHRRINSHCSGRCASGSDCAAQRRVTSTTTRTRAPLAR